MSNAASTDKKYLDVAKTNEIGNRQMKHVEVDGKFYAINDGCGHMNALLSMGNLAENVVTCLFMEQDLILPQARR